MEAHHFQQLLPFFDGDEEYIANASDNTPSVLVSAPTPSLPPEIWFQIFVKACGSMKQLSRLSRLSKSIYNYCWKSPAARANFCIDRYGKDQAIEKLVKIQGHKDPRLSETLKVLVKKGCSHTCKVKKLWDCPLWLLSTHQSAAENIRLFYECNPSILDYHIDMSLKRAGSHGRLDSLCAILKEDPSLITNSQLIARLAEKEIKLDLKHLLQRNHINLITFMGPEYWEFHFFDSKVVSLAIKQNYLFIAEQMISPQIVASTMKLNEIDSDRIWFGLDFTNIQHVTTALSFGVAPTSYALLRSAGCNYLLSACLHCNNNWADEEVPFTLAENAYAVNDIFLQAGYQLNFRVFNDAVVYAPKEYVTYLLEKWRLQENYTNINIIEGYVIHNAYTRRDWDLVEILLEHGRQWAKATGKPAIHLTHSILPNHSSFIYPPPPMDSNDTYFFDKMPILIELRIYPKNAYSLCLESARFLITKSTLDKLISLGAVVTPRALVSASKSRLRMNFLLLLEHYQVNAKVEFEGFERIVRETQHLEEIQMMIAKGIPVMSKALFEMYQRFRRDQDNPIVHEMMSAATEETRMTFFHYFEEREPEAWDMEHVESFLLKFHSLGFRTSQQVADKAAFKMKPRLSMLLQLLVDKC
ncbi:hypothetical protein BCR33DRAFT_771961 [Rhizoclosmatium globosum]|uniref:Uncharacterized protein n=1 Tax=Rhizoclosmatium globosum TaxID=329046 RepID=A0A1Y2BAM5_9FUNG|nr:hypothetical protein BCR33DRAFT_771961 [Rhizoclosmatium globosum]|eukprot:ORY31125.1 hypothetical protein BCR33DRAFT_771961 [Rhizoclosmatium globosum]